MFCFFHWLRWPWGLSPRDTNMLQSQETTSSVWHHMSCTGAVYHDSHIIVSLALALAFSQVRHLSVSPENIVIVMSGFRAHVLRKGWSCWQFVFLHCVYSSCRALSPQGHRSLVKFPVSTIYEIKTVNKLLSLSTHLFVNVFSSVIRVYLTDF